MPRVAADPSAYLDQLTPARAAAAPGTMVSAAGLAKATGITWRVLERWAEKDTKLPVAQRGAHGTKWQFDLVAVLDHLIASGRKIATVKGQRSNEASRLAGMSENASMPLVDFGAEARGAKAIAEARLMTHRLKREQGEYIRADLVGALLNDLMGLMQSETLAITARIDPAGMWPAEHRADVEDELRTVLITVRDRCDAHLANWRNNGGLGRA
jgi:phage terminase Nu1 subunit (DNA packaging protein)